MIICNTVYDKTSLERPTSINPGVKRPPAGIPAGGRLMEVQLNELIVICVKL